MLVLPIKKKWFYMILTGEKREEYRDVKPYYTTRLNKIFNMVDDIPLDYAETRMDMVIKFLHLLRTVTWKREPEEKNGVLNLIKNTMF